MSWPPTPVDMLVYLEDVVTELYPTDHGWAAPSGTKGFAIFSPEYTKQLFDDGLAQRVKGIDAGVCLSEKGREALELIQGKRVESKFQQPDWVLNAASLNAKS